MEPHTGVAKVAQWNKSRRSSLISAMDRLKQPFEFCRWRLQTQHLMPHDHRLKVARCIGGRHGTPRTSPSGAFYLRSALPWSLDLGTPPIGPLIRRAAIARRVGTDSEIASCQSRIAGIQSIALSGAILRKRRALMGSSREDEFEIRIDGRLAFSKKATGRFPTSEEIADCLT
jgi:hypothetical protein